MRNHNAIGFNTFVKNYTSDREAFTRAFLANIFGDGKMPDGAEWMIAESLIVPTHIGIALYSDYVYSDYTDVLPTITIPTLVVSGNSGTFPKGIEAGRWIAAQIPQGEFVPFQIGGHMLFYVEHEKFNGVVADFVKRLP